MPDNMPDSRSKQEQIDPKENKIDPIDNKKNKIDPIDNKNKIDPIVNKSKNVMVGIIRSKVILIIKYIIFLWFYLYLLLLR